jgi:hypothetical protein
MEFYIRQGASDPILKMKLIDDGKNDKSYFNDLLENSDVTFEMIDNKTKFPVILGGICEITTRVNKFNQVSDDYYIIYTFTEDQTSDIGRYEGKFTVQFFDSSQQPTTKLIVPIKEKLFINVI